MRLFKRIARFLLFFSAWYGLLIAPWPGLRQLYGNYFRSIIRLVFTEKTGPRLFEIGRVAAEQPSIDTRITLANEEREDSDGKIPAKLLDLDSRGLGFLPTILIISLSFATPVSWLRRLKVLLWGLFLVHGLIIFSVGIYIWNESTDLGLLTLAQWQKSVTGILEETLVTQIGASFVLPVLFWVLVTFRKQDFDDFWSLVEQTPP